MKNKKRTSSPSGLCVLNAETQETPRPMSLIVAFSRRTQADRLKTVHCNNSSNNNNNNNNNNINNNSNSNSNETRTVCNVN